ncbi:BA14K family protein [Oricola thermophila]|uniref:BA14K family protein n=1 Tax=Oricola thermophila TaxID=2742145 RepID=UPI003D17A3B3
MKRFTLKNAIAVAATAATLATTGIAPVVTAASAETVFVPGITDKIHPKVPGPCATKPWLCDSGMGLKPVDPKPPVPPADPAPGMSAGTAAAIGIVGGIIAGAALANAAQPKEVIIEPVGDPNAHVSWCQARYKSYRVSDNSWQPYHGPRKPCISPYL